MTFGSILADALFGLVIATLVGAYLDHRKRAWKGRSTSPSSPYATPNYKGGLRLPKEKP